jgi:hypothetical protein
MPELDQGGTAMNQEERTEIGADDVVWPLDQPGGDAFAARRLTEAAAAGLISAEEMRTLGLKLMRYGRPMGWLGALLLIDGNKRLRNQA